MRINQKAVNNAQWQSVTGLRTSTFDGLGTMSLRLINLTSTQARNSQFIDNNTQTKIRLEVQFNAVSALQKQALELRQTVREFASRDLSKLNPDYSKDPPVFMSSEARDEMNRLQQMAFNLLKQAETFLNQQFNNQYVFSGGRVQTAPVVIPGNSLAEFQRLFDGNFVTFPTSRTANLNSFSFNHLDMGGLTLEQNITTIVGGPATTGDVTFDTQVNIIRSSIPGAFSDLEEGVQITVTGTNGNDGIYIVRQITADGQDMALDLLMPLPQEGPGVDEVVVDGLGLTITQNPQTGTITAGNIGGFIDNQLNGSPSTTGTIFVDQAKNQLSASINGAFTAVKAGSTIVLSGMADPANNGVKYVRYVSEDGKTIQFEDSTPIVDEPPIAGGTGFGAGITFPIGATINLQNIDPDFNGRYTVIGISDDGTSLIVRATGFPPPGSPVTFPPTLGQRISGETYYRGDQLQFSQNISDHASIDMGLSADYAAFEKLIRACAMLAQGNLVDERDPRDNPHVDPSRVVDRVNEALDLIIDSLTHQFGNFTEERGDLNNVLYSLTMNITRITQTIDQQRLYNNFVLNNIDDILRVDPIESALNLQFALVQLEVSHAVLARVGRLSLLNYL